MHHPEMPVSPDYFRLPTYCGPRAASLLTYRFQFDMLRSSIDWQGSYANRPIEAARFRHASWRAYVTPRLRAVFQVLRVLLIVRVHHPAWLAADIPNSFQFSPDPRQAVSKQVYALCREAIQSRTA